MYYFSPEQNLFFPAGMKQEYIEAGYNLDDVLSVDDSVYNEFAASTPPHGKTRAAGADGLPVWVDIPELTARELSEQHENEKRQRLKAVTEITRLWQTQLMLDIISDADKERLKAWMVYAQRVDKTDTSKHPVIWPDKPE